MSHIIRLFFDTVNKKLFYIIFLILTVYKIYNSSLYVLLYYEKIYSCLKVLHMHFVSSQSNFLFLTCPHDKIAPINLFRRG